MLLGMDFSLWPRVWKLLVDWGYRGLKGLASSLGLELEVVARPYAGVRGVWVREGMLGPKGQHICVSKWRCRRFRGRRGSSLCPSGGWWVSSGGATFCGPLPGWGGIGGSPRTTNRTPR
uniref:Uncharacterized protein n=1 Tax=Thermus islandicus TaxID=540988 RepID=A0A831UGE8_9DEIN